MKRKKTLRRRYGHAARKKDVRKNYKGEMHEYDVHPLDVWGNKREGYSVNDVYPSRGRISIPAVDATDDEIIAALKKEGFIDRNVRASSISIDGEAGYTLYIGHAPTAHPEYELRRTH